MTHIQTRPSPCTASASFAALLRVTQEDQSPPERAAKLGAPVAGLLSGGSTRNGWLSEKIGDQRGVACAFPKSMCVDKVSRVALIGSGHATSRSWWWLWRLRRNEFMQKDSYSTSSAAVHRSDGLQLDPDWFPRDSAYGVALEPEAFEKESVAGIAVCVRRIGPSECSHSMDRAALELKAAAAGIAPVVFASFMVHDDDDFARFQSYTLHADAPAPEMEASEASRICGSVLVTQTHSFRLSDLLSGINAVWSDPMLRVRVSLPAQKATLFEATASLARKLRLLANERVLKLNIVPDTIVFVPRLVERDDGRLEATGFECFREENVDSEKGIPFLSDFDPTFTWVAATSDSTFDSDVAYSTMCLSLLASARAQFGESFRPMLHKVTGRAIDGSCLPENELPERFEDIDLRVALRCSNEKASDFSRFILTKTDSDWAADTAEDVRMMAMRPPSEGDQTPIFSKLVKKLLHTDCDVDTSLFSATQPGAGDELSRRRSEEQRLQVVVDDRRRRMLAQAEPRWLTTAAGQLAI